MEVCTKSEVFAGVLAFQLTNAVPACDPTGARDKAGETRVPDAEKLPSTRKMRLRIPGIVLAVVVVSVTRTLRLTVAKFCPAVKPGIGPPFVAVNQFTPSTCVSTSTVSVLPISLETSTQDATELP